MASVCPSDLGELYETTPVSNGFSCGGGEGTDYNSATASADACAVECCNGARLGFLWRQNAMCMCCPDGSEGSFDWDQTTTQDGNQFQIYKYSTGDFFGVCSFICRILHSHVESMSVVSLLSHC